MRVLGQPETPTQEAHGALPSEARCLRIVVARTVRLEEPMPNTWVGIERQLPPGGSQAGLRRLHLLVGLAIVVFGVVPEISGARDKPLPIPHDQATPQPSLRARAGSRLWGSEQVLEVGP